MTLKKHSRDASNGEGQSQLAALPKPVRPVRYKISPDVRRSMAALAAPHAAPASTAGMKRLRDLPAFNVHARFMHTLGDVAVSHQGARVNSSSLDTLYDLGARALPCQSTKKMNVNYTPVLDKTEAALAAEAATVLHNEFKGFNLKETGEKAVARCSEGVPTMLIDVKNIGNNIVNTNAIRVSAGTVPYYLVVFDLATDWNTNTNPKDRAHYRHVAAVTAEGSCFEPIKTLVDAGCSLVHLNRSMDDLGDLNASPQAVDALRNRFYELYDAFDVEFSRDDGALTWRRYWRCKTPDAKRWSNDFDAQTFAVPVDIFAPIFVEPDLCLGTLSLQFCSLDE